MNISFDGAITNTFNTLPMAAAGATNAPPKRRHDQSGRSGNKRFRRGVRRHRSAPSSPLLISSSSDSNIDGPRQTDNDPNNNETAMTDDSYSSQTSFLDELAESLRECTQNSYSTFLDMSMSMSNVGLHSSNNNLGGGGRRARFMMDYSNTSIAGSGGSNIGIGSSSNEALSSTRSTSVPPMMMNFTRVRHDNPDRL